MPKKSNTKRKDGRIAVQVYLGTVEGNRKYKTVYGKNQKEAEAKADEIRSLLNKGIDVSAQKETFGYWAELWLKSKKNDVSLKQHKTISCFVNTLKKHLEYSEISKIKMSDIQVIIDDLAYLNPNTNKPTAKKTLNDIKNTAKRIFDYAIKNRVIIYNPAIDVTIPVRAPEGHRRALTEEEQSWIINTPHAMQTAALIMMYAGLRRGELIPLLWSDIDFNEKLISVNKSVEMLNDKPVVKAGAKTSAGTRIINIPQKLVDHLKNVEKKNILVCPANNNKMHSNQTWKRQWNSYLLDLDILYGNTPQKKSKFDPRFKGIGIPHFTAHWLRHTYATLLYMAGIDVLTAKEQLGHASIETTLQIYTHLDAKHKKRSMAKLDDYLEDKKDIINNA